jgi:hypothetical protein
VTDRGVGFARRANTDTPLPVGLGLHAADRRVKSIGGRLTVQGAHGGGVDAVIELPTRSLPSAPGSSAGEGGPRDVPCAERDEHEVLADPTGWSKAHGGV